MTSTIFDKNAYDDGIRDAIGKVIDDWGFRYPGIEDVEHVYFYAATAAPPETINAYLDQAYELGKDFGLPREDARHAHDHVGVSRGRNSSSRDPVSWHSARGAPRAIVMAATGPGPPALPARSCGRHTPCSTTIAAGREHELPVTGDPVPAGLSTREAAERLAADGPNELPSGKRRNVLEQVVGVVREPMLLLLVGAGTVNFLLSEPLDGMILM